MNITALQFGLYRDGDNNLDAVNPRWSIKRSASARQIPKIAFRSKTPPPGPTVRILAPSRELLRLSGERIVQVPSLALPVADAAAASSFADLRSASLPWSNSFRSTSSTQVCFALLRSAASSVFTKEAGRRRRSPQPSSRLRRWAISRFRSGLASLDGARQLEGATMDEVLQRVWSPDWLMASESTSSGVFGTWNLQGQTIVDFSLHDVLGAAEQIIRAETPTGRGDVRALEDEIALIMLSLDVSTLKAATAQRADSSGPLVLRHAAPPANADVPGLVIIGLFFLLVFGSITLVNWYFRSTFGTWCRLD
jgi:hypothetical protein